ncbi:MAG: YbhB/YbcL family Raf kinase inhibitor-like protein [Patescibacteria group bacterium]
MKLSSSAFLHNTEIPSQYTCDGRDVNPPLTIEGVPADAQSLVLIVDDPDAPRGDWVHWLVWNINPSTSRIEEDSVPAGAAEGTTDFGRTGWGGPCPPSGVHRYQFKLYALDTTLSLVPSAKKRDVERAMEGHVLVQATLVGLYARK